MNERGPWSPVCSLSVPGHSIEASSAFLESHFPDGSIPLGLHSERWQCSGVKVVGREDSSPADGEPRSTREETELLISSLCNMPFMG